MSSGVVYIYNPFEEMTLMQYGLPYVLKGEGVTVVYPLKKTEFDANETAKQMEQSSAPVGDIEKTVQVTARRVAEELTVKHDYRERGILIFEERPTPAEIAECKATAERFKRDSIEAFRQERIERQSGGHGRNVPDKIIQQWIKELNIEDEVVNPRKAGISRDDLVAISVAVAETLKQTNTTVLANQK